ncbi:MAG: sugar ABC transporter substrate-binding protein [Treponema sp.]|nr:sugar ABC transporter substrate-binding protein [Treponema sp.]
MVSEPPVAQEAQNEEDRHHRGAALRAARRSRLRPDLQGRVHPTVHRPAQYERLARGNDAGVPKVPERQGPVLRRPAQSRASGVLHGRRDQPEIRRHRPAGHGRRRSFRLRQGREAKGIPVITVNLATIQKHTASVQMADISAGYAVGKEMGKQLGGKGNVVIIQSPPGAILGVNREKGFRQAIAELYPNIKIVGAQSAEGWKKEIAITIMNGFLQANKQLDGVFAVNDNMAEGAMIAAEAAGRLDQIKIWGANGQKSTLALIEQGKIAGTAYNNSFAQGSLIAEMVMEILTKKLGPSKAAETKVIQIPPFAATKETVGQIAPEDRW